MPEWVWLLVGFADLVVIVYRLCLVVRAGGDPAMFWYWVGVSLGVPYVLLRLPDVHTRVGQFFGIINIAHPIAISMVVIACFLLRPLLRCLQASDERATPTRLTAVTLLAAVTSIGASFALIPVGIDSTWFTFLAASTPFVLEYQIVYSTWLTAGFLAAGLPSYGYGLVSPDPRVRIGFGVIVPAGFAMGFFALASDVLYGASVRFGTPYPQGVDPVAAFSALSLFGLFALCIGSTLPGWGSHTSPTSWARWLRRYLLYQQMYPLWERLYLASPSIALLAPRSRVQDLLVFRDLEFRLYRRVVEIRDGRLALRDYMEAQVLQAAREVCREARLRETDYDLVAAAAGLTFAAQAKLLKVPRSRPTLPTLPAFADVDGEARTLARVAQYCLDERLLSQIGSRLESRSSAVSPPPMHHD
jgi:hypothetical protein